jgi:glycosyltransferase involved in cell wall biosynthesis
VFRNRLYYGLKPLMPASVRLAIRRWFALRKREQVYSTWPILPGSERPPANWPGWPDGKQFAFVLTHDVEGPAGLAKCRQLMELEMKLGFRSSFNFIPEGDYTVQTDLIADLKKNGFEVGVHDLHHDGSLYRSRKDFSHHAQKINQYVKAWGAAGFRSGSMFHNLDWLHDLDVTYDASTFDTDPFEPQPDGVNTIFPFFVPSPHNPNLNHNPNHSLPHGSPSGPLSSREASKREQSPYQSSSTHDSPFAIHHSHGYIELPYTLPQDSTLFLLLQERHPDIWFQKLDWIAKHGGMALVNVHPDYLSFGDVTDSTYPVTHYEDLLAYLNERHSGRYWHGLPKQVALLATQNGNVSRRKPKRICLLTYSHYQADARVTRYAEALADRGDHVDVLALQRSPNLPTREKLGNVNLFRIQRRFGKKEKSRISYLLPVLRFLATASVSIARRHRKEPYDVLHINNIPDFLVFAGWYPRLTGAKVILDIHDIVPEFYASKFDSPKSDSKAVSALKWIERRSAAAADRIIIANDLWLEKYATRTGANGKCCVFINNVDANIFFRRPRTRRDGKLIILFPGGLQWHQGLDIAIRAFELVTPQLPNAEFHIYGDGNMKDDLKTLAQDLGLSQKVLFFDPLPVREIAEIMANADLGVVPKRADSFGNEAYSTKIMEFMSLGVPVVASSTKIDRFYFNDSVLRFFESGNVEDLAKAMVEVLTNVELSRRLVTNAFAYAEANNWESRKTDYLALVDSLIRGQKSEV